MPEVDVDLASLEDLEFEIPCDGEQCDKAAEWIWMIRLHVCGCRFTYVICEDHLRKAERMHAQRAATVLCAKCGTILGHFIRPADVVDVVRKEPVKVGGSL